MFYLPHNNVHLNENNPYCIQNSFIKRAIPPSEGKYLMDEPNCYHSTNYYQPIESYSEENSKSLINFFVICTIIIIVCIIFYLLISLLTYKKKRPITFTPEHLFIIFSLFRNTKNNQFKDKCLEFISDN